MKRNLGNKGGARKRAGFAVAAGLAALSLIGCNSLEWIVGNGIKASHALATEVAQYATEIAYSREGPSQESTLAPLEPPTYTPTVLPNYPAQGQTQSVTPTVDAMMERMAADGMFSIAGFTPGQMDAYLEMDAWHKQMFYNLVEIGGNDIDIYKKKLTPDSIEALWGYLEGFDAEARKEILLQPNSPINMMGSHLYVLDLSDNSSPYFLALASDVMSERFGLELKLSVDNSEPGSAFSRNFEEYYSGDPHKIGMTVQDRVDKILEYRKSPESAAIANLDEAVLREYVAKKGLESLRNPSLQSARAAILEIERLEREKGYKGPVTIYVIAHNNISTSKLLVNESSLPDETGKSNKGSYSAEELFPPSFFDELEGVHFNFVIATCPVNFMDQFEAYLNREGVSHTILTSYLNNRTWTPLNDISNALELASNIEPESIHPAVGLEDLTEVAYGTIQGKEITMADNGTTYLYTFWPYEIVGGERGRWAVDSEMKGWDLDGIGYQVYLEITHNGKQTLSSRDNKTYTYEVGFHPAVISNLPYQDQIALFGLNLEQIGP